MSATHSDLTRGPVVLTLSICTACLAISTCVVRFIVRWRMRDDIGVDDFAIGLATLVAFVGTTLGILEGAASEAGSQARALEFNVLGQPWLLMATTLAKISACLFFARLLLGGGSRAWRAVLLALACLLALVEVVFALSTNLQCRPLEKLWNPAAEGECGDLDVQLGLGYFQGAISVVSWLFLSLFPVLIVRDLDLQRSMRWPFYILSGLSLFAGSLAVTRTYDISQIPARSGIYTYANFIATLLATLEQNVSIIAANVIPMGPLFSQSQRQQWQRGGADAAGGFGKGFHGSSTASGPFARLKDSPSSVTLATVEGSSRGGHGGDGSNDLAPIRSGSSSSSRRSKRGSGSPDSDDDGGRWPHGIIKTVEVEVVEEDIADYDRVNNAASRASSERDWDRMLRDGRSRTGFA